MKDFLRHLLHIAAVAGATTAAGALTTGPITSGHVLIPAGAAGLAAVIRALVNPDAN